MAFFGACRKEAKIKLPEQEEKLVLTCFISPDDTVITAIVRTSKPKYVAHTGWGSDGDVISNADVRISRDGASAVMPYDDVYHCYFLPSRDFPILPNVTYSISATTPDGKFASGATTVPFDTLKIEKFDLALNFSPDSTELDITASGVAADIPGKTNYVGLYYRQFIFPSDSQQHNYDFIDYGNGTFEDDERQERRQFRLQQQMYSMGGNMKVNYAGIFAEFWVLNCSKDFYLYNRSVQLAAYSGANPFGDPVMVYTNISNGFGCFGSYRVSKREMIK